MVLPENLECPTHPDGLLGPSGDNIKKSYCFAWKTAWQSVPGGNNGISHSICMKNHLLPKSVFPPPQFPLRFFLPAGRGGGMRVVAMFYGPFAAFCSCHLCFSLCFSQGLERHTGELYDVILAVLGRIAWQAQIACYQLVYHEGLYYTISSCSFGVWLWLITLPNTCIWKKWECQEGEGSKEGWLVNELVPLEEAWENSARRLSLR